MPNFTLPSLPKLSRLWLVLLCLFAYTLMKTHYIVVAQSSEVGKDGDKDDGKDDDGDSGGDDSGSDDSGGDDNSGSGGGGDSGGSDDSEDDNSGGGSDNSGSSDDGDDNSGSGNSGGGSDNDDSSNDDSGSDNSGNDDSGNSGNSGNGNNGGNSGNGNSGNGNSGNGGNSGNDDNDNDNNDNDNNEDNSNNDNSGHGNDNSGGDDKPKDADEAQEDNSGKDEKDDRLYYVGTVSASDGSSLLADGAKLQSTSPWVEVLGTGMWFEAYGYWQGEDTFIADEVNVLAGDDWAYVRAPAVLLGQREERQIEAWTRGNVIDTQREASQSVSEDSVRVVAYFDGVKVRAVPQALTPPAPDLPAGWTEFIGRFDGDGIVWESSRQFP